MEKDVSVSTEQQADTWREAARLFDEFQLLTPDAQATFESALQRESAAVQAAFAQLQQADRQAAEESFLGNLSIDELTSPDARIGHQVGQYRIESLIAEGGTGIVYRARRTTGYEQCVAIKFLSSRFQTGRGRARFQAERQALAELTHPNICRLLDAGDLDDGTPYLVMEFINGGPISEYCQAQDVPLHDRVRLFAEVCRAVSYAHDKGILHRDLKPGNVLVDERGRVRVTDFGLAKSLDEDASAAGLTLTGEILGTPGYMAPEQAFRELGEPGVTTDVYGLGAVLYGLLVERPPFRSDSIAGTLLMVKEQEPLSPAALQRQVSRDLDTICLRCLQKRPADRYPSVDALLDDVERSLDDRPIFARPVGPAERLLRWARRNRAVAALTAALAGVTVVALIVLSVMLAIARSDRQEALKQRGRARAAVDSMFTETSKWLAEHPQSTDIRRKLLLAARDEYEQFAREMSGGDRTLDVEVATAWFRLGKIEGELGNHQARARAAKEALNRFQSLAQRFPEHHEYQFDVFHAHFLNHDISSAFETIRDLAERAPDPDGKYRATYASFSGVYAGQALGFPQHEAVLMQSLELSRELQQEFPTDLDLQTQFHGLHATLAKLRIQQSDFASAQAHTNEAIDVLRQRIEHHPHDLGLAAILPHYFELKAAALSYGGKAAEALAAAEQAVQLSAEIAAAQPTSKHYADLFRRAAETRLGVLMTDDDATRRTAAERAYLAVLEARLERFPTDDRSQLQMAEFLLFAESPDLRNETRARQLVRNSEGATNRSDRCLTDLLKLKLGDLAPLDTYRDSGSPAMQMAVAWGEALAGNCDRARALAETLEQPPPTPNLMLWHRQRQVAASIRALCQPAPQVTASDT